MAISKEQLERIINGRAKDLCNSNFDRMVESKTSFGKARGDSYDYYEDEIDTYDEPEEEYNNDSDMEYNANTAMKSKMPDHIKHSMLNETIDVTGLGNLSVLDSLNIKPTQKKKTKPQKINEVANNSHNQTIDYTIIKAIVNECLNEYFSKQQLNESTTLKTIGLSNGNISIVDNKGNIFKAKLEKIGNKNEL